jgi:hypothetical protein
MRLVGRMTPFGVETGPDPVESIGRVAPRLLLKRVSDVLREVYQQDAPSRGIRPNVGPKGHVLSALSGPHAGELGRFWVPLCHWGDGKLPRRNLCHGRCGCVC